MEDESNVVIPTLDPRFVKGVRSVTEIAYNAAIDAGLDAEIVYNAIPWDECLTVRDLLRGHLDVPITEQQIDDLNGIGIGRILPEFEVFNYLLNYNYWQARLNDAGAILAVGGPCLTGIPAARADEKFVVWFGTTIEDERDVQKVDYSLPERFRYELIQPVLRRYERYVLRKADKVFAQSSYTRSCAIELHNLRPGDVEILPCAVDTDQFCPDPEVGDSLEIVFVGRLNDPRKNLSLLLDAFKRVTKRVPNAQLTLVGGKPDARYRARIKELGLSSHVHIPGEVESVIPYLQRAAVFAYPSYQEGFGIAALEALSCGTPVVSTNCGGPTDFVIDGETGFIVDLTDTDTFGDRLVTLLEDRERRDQFAEEGRSLAQRKFSQKHISGRLQSIFSKYTKDDHYPGAR